MNISDELMRIVDALNAANIDYAVAGGLAVAIHGYPRLTVDIDLLIMEKDLDRARDVLATTGFDLETGWIRLRPGQADEERLFRLTKTAAEDFLTLDLILVTPSLIEVWNQREPFQLGDRQLWVISRNGLLTMKRRAGRPQDLADIAALESEVPPE